MLGADLPVMTFPHALRALNNRDFRVFYAGQAVSLVGTWMQSVAQSWLVLELTNSPFRLGLIGTLQFGPVLALSIVAGALADRVRKRRLLLVTQSLLGVQVLLMAALVWHGSVQYWQLCVLALLIGVTNTVDMPARQSFVGQMVGKNDLVSGVALNSAAFNSARIVGPALAGLLIARVGLAPAFLLNGLSFLVVIAALLAVKLEGEPGDRGPTTLGEEIRAGLVYAARSPRIRFMLTLLFVVSLCVFNFSVFVPLLARDVLGLGAQGFGLLMAALGVGAVTGAVSLGVLGRSEPHLQMVVVAAAVACAGILGLAWVRQVSVAAVFLFAVGLSAIMTVASCNTTLQLTTPDELRGRVMSLYTLIFGGTFPIGSLLVGSVAERWSIQTALLGAGAVGLLGVATLAVLGRSTLSPSGRVAG
jgi:predicted MFS family arabinose efflux permease